MLSGWPLSIYNNASDIRQGQDGGVILGITSLVSRAKEHIVWATGPRHEPPLRSRSSCSQAEKVHDSVQVKLNIVHLYPEMHSGRPHPFCSSPPRPRKYSWYNLAFPSSLRASSYLTRVLHSTAFLAL